jgi:hypothetical protein
MSNISSTALAAHFENWELTPENIDTLPEPLRRYVHRLETISDPADRALDMNCVLSVRSNPRWLGRYGIVFSNRADDVDR